MVIPYPWGLEANRPTLEALIQYAYSQKIIPTPVRRRRVFAPTRSTSSRFRKPSCGYPQSRLTAQIEQHASGMMA